MCSSDLEILKTGFTTNQKKWLNDLKALTDGYYAEKEALDETLV